MNGLGQLITIGIISGTAAIGTFLIKGAPERKFVCDPASLQSDEVCLEQISPSDLILWVDARSRTDWEKTGFLGSILWNLETGEDVQAFESQAAIRILETPRVIVYCGDENCGVSRQVAEKIRGLQLDAKVSALRGGWRALSEAGYTKNNFEGEKTL